jgi:hypothetical protein
VSPKEIEQEPTQARLNTMLRWGVAFSIVWLAGVGSLIALCLGLRGRWLISTNVGLHGMGRAWWCIIVGGIGVAVLAALLAAAVLSSHSN